MDEKPSRSQSISQRIAKQNILRDAFGLDPIGADITEENLNDPSFRQNSQSQFDELSEKMTNKLKEKDVQRVIGKRIREAGGFIHKISDFDVGYKPFDFFGIIAGTPFYIETKDGTGKRVFLSLVFDQTSSQLLKKLRKTKGVTNIVSGFAFFIEGRDPSSDIFSPI